MTELGKPFHGRKVIYIERFEGVGDNDFWGYHKATKRLGDMGYEFGSMEGPQPIAFSVFPPGVTLPLPKWKYVTPGMKLELHGVMIAHNGDWRHGTVKILWWELPIVSPLDEIPWERLTKLEKV